MLSTTPLTFWFPFSIALAALAGVIVVIVAQVRNNREQQALVGLLESIRGQRSAQSDQRFDALAAEFAELKEQLTQLQSQVEQGFQHEKDAREQVATAVMALTKQHEALATKLNEQQSAIQEVAEQDPASKFYQRAAKLVQQGATLEEVMDACELPRAEAELVYSLYAKR